MPIATPAQYAAMLDAAQQGGYAYPAINVTSIATINAALKGFADKKSDGIIQFSTGAGEFASGLNVKDAVFGTLVLAEAAHRLAEKYDILIGLHTDHCQPKKVDGFLRPLIAATAERRAAGNGNLFNSHMFDGSELDIKANMEISKDLLKLCVENEIILEVEAGVVGGEEDGIDHSDVPADKLYTTPEDMVYVHEELSPIGRYMFAATFGNVHGHYKPGETLDYGVIKMNIDTDTQYAFTRPVVDHIMKNYDGVLKIDGEIGVKKAYDPRSYIKLGENGVATRMGEACDDLKSSGQTIFGKV